MDQFNQHGLRISRKNGLFLASFLIAYFLIMRVLGLGHEYYLRLFNGLILILMMRQGIIAYRRFLEEEKYGSSFDFFRLNLRTAFIGIAVFTVFLAIYLDIIDPAFMAELKEQENANPFLSPVSAAGIVFIEGLGSAFVLSYLVVQAMKKRTIELQKQSAK
tara:strand:- start:2342 stop:2824 length:483 start_codon:yes stop_codon:yes gene_type:complete